MLVLKYFWGVFCIVYVWFLIFLAIFRYLRNIEAFLESYDVMTQAFTIDIIHTREPLLVPKRKTTLCIQSLKRKEEVKFCVVIRNDILRLSVQVDVFVRPFLYCLYVYRISSIYVYLHNICTFSKSYEKKKNFILLFIMIF